MPDDPFDFSKPYTDESGRQWNFGGSPSEGLSPAGTAQVYDAARGRGYGGDYTISNASNANAVSGGGPIDAWANTPGLQDWITGQGWRWGTGGQGSSTYGGYFDASGKPIAGTQIENQLNDPTGFALGALGIGGFGALAAGGAGAAAEAAPYAGTGGLPGAGYGTEAGAGYLGAEAGAVPYAGTGGAPAAGYGTDAGASYLAADGTAIAPDIASGLTPGEVSQVAPMGAETAPGATTSVDGTVYPGTGGAPGAGYGTELGATSVDSLPSDVLDRALKTITKDPLRSAQVGLSGYALAKQLRGGGSAQSQYNQIAGPEKAVSNQLLAQFSAGQLSGADAFAIQDWSQKQKASIDDYFARAGLSNSTMHLDALNRANQQAEQMRQQAIQNLLTGGLKAAGVADPALAAGINAGLKQDQAAQEAMQKFLATLAAMNTAHPPAPAPAPADSEQTGTPS